MINKNIIIQKVDKAKTIVITDKENVEKKLKWLFKILLDNDKLSKNMSMIQIFVKVLDQKHFIVILNSINLLLTTCQNFNRFCLL